ncbi:MAG: hypothetical protein PHV97_03490 [Candidatus Omnitrophica bacterium]|nr:hypothetical protein [Candidatus Omnitrophota bacterium]
MEIEKQSFQQCAKALIDLVLESEGHDIVYSEFCALEPRLKSAAIEAFCREFVPAKLALGCVYWVGCCAHHRIEDKDLKNLYFKEVMNLFGSPKSLEEATRFSESLYASNADKEQSPVLGILVHLFHKLGLEAIVKPGDSDVSALNAGFHFMMHVSEALKVVFESKFDDFFYANEDLRIADTRKKG